MLLISHDLNEVMELSDRIAVIYDGAMWPGGAHGELSEYELGYIMMGGKSDEDAKKNQPA